MGPHVLPNWADLRYASAPEPVQKALHRSMLDLAGVAVAGAGTQLSKTIRDHAAAHFGGTGSSILCDGRQVSPVGAALAGGMTIDAMDAHDGFKPVKGHNGCGVFPAALALAEAEGLDLEAFFDLVLLGYEVGARAGMALHATACDYHTSGAWVAVATAALGSQALALSAAQTAHALGIAEYHGPRSQMMRCIDHPTMVKDGSGWGAMAGLSAAYLARDGFAGAPALTVTDAGVAELWSDLGQRWYMLDQYLKPQPVCRWAQPAVVAALAVQAAHGFDAKDIQQIDVTSFHEATRLATTHPKTTEEAQYSLPFPVAAALVFGVVGPQQVDGSALQDPSVHTLARAVRLHEDESFNAAFPARRPAQVEVTLKSGTRYKSDVTEAHGDPEAPLSDAEILEKFDQYSAAVGQDRQTALKRLLWEGTGTTADLTDALCAPLAETS